VGAEASIAVEIADATVRVSGRPGAERFSTYFLPCAGAADADAAARVKVLVATKPIDFRKGQTD